MESMNMKSSMENTINNVYNFLKKPEYNEVLFAVYSAHLLLVFSN